jgi:hypothetical protein
MSTAPGVTTSPNVVEPGAENPRKRATHAIQRLREKRELERQIRSGAVLREAQATKKVSPAVRQVHPDAVDEFKNASTSSSSASPPITPRPTSTARSALRDEA